MNIVIEYDSTVNNAPAAFKTAVQAAVNYFDNLIVNPVTVPIMFSYGELDGQALGADTLGESSTNGNIESYASLVSLLGAAAASNASYQSVLSLPGTDPTGGGRFWVSDAQAKVFGLGSLPGYTDPEDGFVALSSTASFSYDANNRAVSGSYDAIGVLEHEISETLGRVSYLGTGTFEGYTLYSPMDLFRYASAGVRDLTNTAGYFSIDGQTMVSAYNDPSNGGDAGDWNSSGTVDAFNAFTESGVLGAISRADLLEMNALGFQVNWGASNDFTASGNSDILWRNNNGDAYLYLNKNGASFSGFTGQDIGTVPGQWTIQGIADFNGDGKADILWRDTGGDVYLYQSNSGGGYTGFTGQNVGVVSTPWTIQGVGDFNGDGKADILWRNTGGDTLIYVASSGAGYSSFASHDLGVVSLDWTIQKIGDFNGDGQADILWRNTAGDVYLWNSNGGSAVNGFTGKDLGVVANTWTIQAVGDFNGDGKADILWRNAGGDVYQWNSNTGSGFTGFTGHDVGVVPIAWTIDKVGDFNGDGKADILWRNANGDVDLWLSNTGSGFTGHDLGVVSADWHII